MIVSDRSLGTILKEDALESVTISDLIDSRPARAAQLALVGVVLVSLVLDGLDIQLLAFAAPLIIAEWGISKSDFSPALAGALIGMVVGTGAGGYLGDRIGRKTVFVASVLSFGVFTAIASLAQGPWTLLLLRLSSGVAFGAAYPNGIALVSEWLPARLRARAVSILATAPALGGMIGAGIAYLYIEFIGWRGLFAACGILTLCVGLVTALALQESPAWLMRTRRDQRARHVMGKVLGELPQNVTLDTNAASARPTAGIFTQELKRLNIGAPLSFFGLAFVNYSVVSWMPTILTSLGFDLADAVGGSFLYNGLAIAGSIATAFLIDRFGSRTVLLTSTGLSLILIVVLGFLLNHARNSAGIDGTDKYWILAVFGLSGFVHALGLTSLYAILANGYPPAARSSGIGFGMMAGRIGGITAVLISGPLLALGHDDPAMLFVTLAAFTLVASLAALAIDRHYLPARRRLPPLSI